MSGIKIIAVVLAACSACACAPLTPEKAADSLQKALDSRIGGREGVKNAVLYVQSGRKGFTWAGAAGIADPAAGLPMTADTPFHTASVGKILTAVSIARLAEQGKLSFDDPIGRYLSPDIMEGLHVMDGRDYSAGITIRHLLSHTSGLPDFYSDTPADSTTFLQIAKREPERFWTPEDTIRFSKEHLQPLFPPGTGFHYTDTEYNLLGLILERVSGRTLAEVFAGDYFRPLGLSHSRLYTGIPKDPEVAHVFFGDWDATENIPLLSASWAACSLVSTAGDMGKLMRALADGALLPSGRLEEMRSNARELYGKGITYGCGFMMINFPRLSPFLIGFPPAWGHSGSTGAFLYYCPALDAVMAGTMDQQAAEQTHVMLIIEALGILRSLR